METEAEADEYSQELRVLPDFEDQGPTKDEDPKELSQPVLKKELVSKGLHDRPTETILLS